MTPQQVMTLRGRDEGVPQCRPAVPAGGDGSRRVRPGLGYRLDRGLVHGRPLVMTLAW